MLILDIAFLFWTTHQALVAYRRHRNSPFLSCLWSLCQTSLRGKPFIGKQVPLQVHFHANQTHFHMKGFRLGLVLKQRHKITWKWPIIFTEELGSFFNDLLDFFV